jgi:hypothetical protein
MYNVTLGRVCTAIALVERRCALCILSSANLFFALVVNCFRSSRSLCMRYVSVKHFHMRDCLRFDGYFWRKACYSIASRQADYNQVCVTRLDKVVVSLCVCPPSFVCKGTSGKIHMARL